MKDLRCRRSGSNSNAALDLRQAEKQIAENADPCFAPRGALVRWVFGPAYFTKVGELRIHNGKYVSHAEGARSRFAARKARVGG